MVINNYSYSADTNSRYFTEDISVGLKYIKTYAKKLGIATPSIDEVYDSLNLLMES